VSKIWLAATWVAVLSAGLLVFWLIKLDQPTTPISITAGEESQSASTPALAQSVAGNTADAIDSEPTEGAARNYNLDLIGSESNELYERTAVYRESLRNALSRLNQSAGDSRSTDQRPETNPYSSSELRLKESSGAERVSVRSISGRREVTEIYQRGGQGTRASDKGAPSSLRWLEGLASTDSSVVSPQLIKNLSLNSERCIGKTCVYNYERKVGDLVAWDHEVKIIKEDGSSARVKGLLNVELNEKQLLAQSNQSPSSLDSSTLEAAFESHYPNAKPIALESEPERGIVLGRGMVPQVVDRVVVAFSPFDRRLVYFDPVNLAIVREEPLQIQAFVDAQGVDSEGDEVVFRAEEDEGFGRYVMVDDQLIEGQKTSFRETESPSKFDSRALVNAEDPKGAWSNKKALTVRKNLGKTFDYFKNAHGYAPINPRGRDLEVAIVGRYQNAAMSGDNLMIVGTGYAGAYDFSSSLDVLAHEISHGIVSASGNLAYVGPAGAINESIADFFGAAIDGNWVIGEKAYDEPLRDMAEPWKYGAGEICGVSFPGQPGHFSDYVSLPWWSSCDYGGVHINSGIMNRALYLMAEGLAIEGKGDSMGIEKTAELVFSFALGLSRWDSIVSMASYLNQRSVELYGEDSLEANSVKAAIEAVGIPSKPRPGRTAEDRGWGPSYDYKRQMGNLDFHYGAELSCAAQEERAIGLLESDGYGASAECPGISRKWALLLSWARIQAIGEMQSWARDVLKSSALSTEEVAAFLGVITTVFMNDNERYDSSGVNCKEGFGYWSQDYNYSKDFLESLYYCSGGSRLYSKLSANGLKNLEEVFSISDPLAERAVWNEKVDAYLAISEIVGYGGPDPRRCTDPEDVEETAGFSQEAFRTGFEEKTTLQQLSSGWQREWSYWPRDERPEVVPMPYSSNVSPTNVSWGADISYFGKSANSNFDASLASSPVFAAAFEYEGHWYLGQTIDSNHEEQCFSWQSGAALAQSIDDLLPSKLSPGEGMSILGLEFGYPKLFESTELPYQSLISLVEDDETKEKFLILTKAYLSADNQATEEIYSVDLNQASESTGVPPNKSVSVESIKTNRAMDKVALEITERGDIEDGGSDDLRKTILIFDIETGAVSRPFSGLFSDNVLLEKSSFSNVSSSKILAVKRQVKSNGVLGNSSIVVLDLQTSEVTEITSETLKTYLEQPDQYQQIFQVESDSGSFMTQEALYERLQVHGNFEGDPAPYDLLLYFEKFEDAAFSPLDEYLHLTFSGSLADIEFTARVGFGLLGYQPVPKGSPWPDTDVDCYSDGSKSRCPAYMTPFPRYTLTNYYGIQGNAFPTMGTNGERLGREFLLSSQLLTFVPQLAQEYSSLESDIIQADFGQVEIGSRLKIEYCVYNPSTRPITIYYEKSESSAIFSNLSGSIVPGRDFQNTGDYEGAYWINLYAGQACGDIYLDGNALEEGPFKFKIEFHHSGENSPTSTFVKGEAVFVDSDGDGVPDLLDAFPDDASESADFDSDELGDNEDDDDDNDGVKDDVDLFPFNASESFDNDGDGIGDNSDTDDDNDGLSDSDEEAAGTNPISADSDNDGVDDAQDDLPLDAKETTDTDSDGIGNNADDDDDNDGLTDQEEGSLGSNPLIRDSDGDGVEDGEDAFPIDAAETKDSDDDGVGDNSDLFPEDGKETVDSDGDGVGDNADLFDDDPFEAYDTDLDGIGNNADDDDDGDGFTDEEELADGTNPLSRFSCREGCFSFDVDENREAKALTDGLLVIRHLFGFTGDALASGAVASDAERTLASDISSLLSDADSELDIDGNGESKALSDGLLLIRYLFGFAGDALIAGAIGDGATRDTSEAVEEYIKDRVPVSD
jgi:hypothetical protein